LWFWLKQYAPPRFSDGTYRVVFYAQQLDVATGWVPQSLHWQLSPHVQFWHVQLGLLHLPVVVASLLFGCFFINVKI